MAEQRLLKRASGGVAEFSNTDTVPVANLPTTSVISPAQITANQDNYSPTGWADADVVRININTTGWAITGFAAWTNTKTKTIINTSENFGYIPCEHPGSNAANRVLGVCDHIIAPYGILVIEYDDTSGRVRVASNSFDMSNLSGKKGGFCFVSPGATLGTDWGKVGFGISGGNNEAVAGTSTLPGVWGINTSTSASGISTIYLTKTVNSPFWVGQGHGIVSCLVYFATLSNGTETYTFSFGKVPGNSTVLDTSNEVTIRYSHGLNSGKFLGVSRSSSSESTADLGVTVAANTLYVLTICTDDSRNEARFYVDGVYRNRTTSNIPSTNYGVRALIAKSAGTTQRSAFIANLMGFNIRN